MILLVKPASLMATRWKFMESAFGSGGIDAPESSQLCRGEDSLQYRCGAQAANDLDAFIARRPVNCSPLSLDPYGRTVATCSVGGTDLGEWLVRKGWRWTGLNTRRADMAKLSVMPSAPAEESGREVTSSRGSIVPASVRTEGHPPARMMRMPILDSALERAANRHLNMACSWSWRDLGDSR